MATSGLGQDWQRSQSCSNWTGDYWIKRSRFCHGEGSESKPEPLPGRPFCQSAMSFTRTKKFPNGNLFESKIFQIGLNLIVGCAIVFKYSGKSIGFSVYAINRPGRAAAHLGMARQNASAILIMRTLSAFWL